MTRSKMQHPSHIYTAWHIVDTTQIAEMVWFMDNDPNLLIGSGTIVWDGASPVYLCGGPSDDLSSLMTAVSTYWYNYWLTHIGFPTPPYHITIDDGLRMTTDHGNLSINTFGYFEPLDIRSILVYGSNTFRLSLINDWGFNGYGNFWIWFGDPVW